MRAVARRLTTSCSTSMVLRCSTTMMALAGLVASALLGSASGFSGAWAMGKRGDLMQGRRGGVVARPSWRPAQTTMSMMADAPTGKTTYAQCSKVGTGSWCIVMWLSVLVNVILFGRVAWP